MYSSEASRGAGVHSCDCERDRLFVRFPLKEILYFHFFALASSRSAAFNSATQHGMPPEFGRKWGTECLNTKFALPTLLCA